MMDEFSSLIEDGKYVLVPKDEDIKELLSDISNLNTLENIDYFLVRNATITFRILEGESINFYARDLDILVEELDVKVDNS